MRRRWLGAAVAGLALPVAACSGGAERCEEAFTAVTMSVDGVASATWDCSEQFGGGWQRGDVVIEAADENEAVSVMDAIMRAYATSPDLEDRWATPQEFKTRDVRAHYGITPG